MKNLLEYILIHLVDYPEDVVVTQSGDANHLVFTIQANSADYGRIIGKSGSMISSIRNIMTVRAIKEQVRVTVIVDSGEKDAAAPAPVAPTADDYAADPNTSAAPEVAETVAPEAEAEVV
jgi:predicted RNA-binding protein YlqC (UPF0109 family)